MAAVARVDRPLSYIAWVDYSERERKAMLDVLSLFKQQGVLDELGIGTIRDAIADTLFPGTSTIQTRARYFLIVPWIYQYVERRGWYGQSAARFAQIVEGKVTESLKKSAPSSGVIGAEVGAAIRRPASDIYWQGLARWRIRLFHGSRSSYHRWLDYQRLHRSLPAAELADAEDAESPIERSGRWHRGMPKAPEGFPELLTLDLLPVEADYLRLRIMAAAPASLLAVLVSGVVEIGEAPLAWEGVTLAELPPKTSEQLRVAQVFSEVMHGAALLYNLLLAQKYKGELVDTYAARFASWSDLMSANRDRTLKHEADKVLAMAAGHRGAVPVGTANFVRDWFASVDATHASRRSAATLASDAGAASLIRTREWQVKGPRARLEKREADAFWSGESGAAQLDFRWRVVQGHLRDIYNGIQG